MRDAITTLSEEVWPAYNLHGDVLGGYWDRLYDEFAESQFVLCDDEAHDVIVEGHTIPCDWDGAAEGLGDWRQGQERVRQAAVLNA